MILHFGFYRKVYHYVIHPKNYNYCYSAVILVFDYSFKDGFPCVCIHVEVYLNVKDYFYMPSMCA